MTLKRSFLYGAFLGILTAMGGIDATHWRIINYGVTPIDASFNQLMMCNNSGNTLKNIQPGQIANFKPQGMCIGAGIKFSRNGQTLGGNSNIALLFDKNVDVYAISSADGTIWTAQTA